MANEHSERKRLLARIVAPLLIALALVVIWAVKTSSQGPAVDEPTGYAADHALVSTSIDLDTLKRYGLPIIIDFGADSCDQCKQMAPILQEINAEMQGSAIVKFVDVWENPRAAQDFPVQLIPTQIFVAADGMPYVPSEGIRIGFVFYNDRNTGEHLFTLHQGGLADADMRIILADMGVDS